MSFNGYLRMSEKEERRQEYQLSILLKEPVRHNEDPVKPK